MKTTQNERPLTSGEEQYLIQYLLKHCLPILYFHMFKNVWIPDINELKYIGSRQGTKFDCLLLAEKGDAKHKQEALKKVIQMILNGEKFSPSLLMTVIRFVMPMQDHTIKKLLLVFWEVVPKHTSEGKLMQEMILVCDAYRRVSI